MDRKIQRTAAVRTMSLLLALAAMMCLSACSLLNLNKKEEAADSRNTYQIYYTNAEHSRLQSISYEPQEQTFEGLLSEMLDYFEQPDKLETDSYSVIPEGVKINGYTIGVDSLLIDFSGSYISMNNIEEILLRAGDRTDAWRVLCGFTGRQHQFLSVRQPESLLPFAQC